MPKVIKLKNYSRNNNYIMSLHILGPLLIYIKFLPLFNII